MLLFNLGMRDRVLRAKWLVAPSTPRAIWQSGRDNRLPPINFQTPVSGPRRCTSQGGLKRLKSTKYNVAS